MTDSDRRSATGPVPRCGSRPKGRGTGNHVSLAPDLAVPGNRWEPDGNHGNRFNKDAGGWRFRGLSNGACWRLRALFRDGEWHDEIEVFAVGGRNFAKRLSELRRGRDFGPPLVIERQAYQRGRFPARRYRSAPGAHGLPAPVRSVAPLQAGDLHAVGIGDGAGCERWWFRVFGSGGNRRG